MQRTRLILIVIITCMASPTLWAQDPLDTLRQKTPLTDEDRGVIRQWVSQQVQTVISEAGSDSVAALTALRNGANDAGAAFRSDYITACVETVAAGMVQAPLKPAARLLTVFYNFDDPTTVRVFVEALRDKRAAIRACGAAGLRRLAGKLATEGAASINPVLTALRDAGRAEKSSAVLQAIYRAMDYANLPDAAEPRAVAAAVLELLEARAANYTIGQTASAAGADIDGLQILNSQRITLDDAQQRRLTIVVAKMLRYCVWRYASASDLHRPKEPNLVVVRNQLEIFIGGAEQQLIKLGQRGPSIAEAIKGGEDLIDTWNQWAAAMQEAVGEDLTLEQLPEDAAESDDEEKE